jgi:hypothetical protein
VIGLEAFAGAAREQVEKNLQQTLNRIQSPFSLGNLTEVSENVVKSRILYKCAHFDKWYSKRTMVFVCYSKGILLPANKESGKLLLLCLLLLFWDVHIFMKKALFWL